MKKTVYVLRDNSSKKFVSESAMLDTLGYARPFTKRSSAGRLAEKLNAAAGWDRFVVSRRELHQLLRAARTTPLGPRSIRHLYDR